MNAPLVRETKAAEALKAAYPEVADDEDAARALVEGETRLHELLGYVLRSIMDDEALIAATGQRIKELQERKKRFENRAARKRAMCQEAMETAALSKFEGADCTAFVATRKPKLTVYDVDELLDDFIRIERKPDTTAIRAALEKGDAVPGASLSNSAPSLTLRTK